MGRLIRSDKPMKYFVDGFVMGANPSKLGGGFTIVDEANRFIMRRRLMRAGFTNNDGEILGIYFALKHAAAYDTISSDSKCAIWWAEAGRSKKRKDLSRMLTECRQMIQEKKITLVWEGRDDNLAGIFNENEADKYRKLRMAKEKGIEPEFADFVEHL